MGYWLNRVRAATRQQDPDARPRADLTLTALMLDRAEVPPSVSDGLEVLYTKGRHGNANFHAVFELVGVEYGSGMPETPRDISKTDLAISARASTLTNAMASLNPRIFFLLLEPEEVAPAMAAEFTRVAHLTFDDHLVRGFYRAHFGVDLAGPVGIPPEAYAHMRGADLVWASRRGEEGFLARLRELCPLDDAEKDRAWKEPDAKKKQTAKPAVVDRPAAANVVKPEGQTKLSAMSGFGEAGEWGMRLAEDLRLYAQGEIAWSEVDKGVLLTSPPGGGKSTFARALAAECGVPLYVSTYADWEGGMTDRHYVVGVMQKAFDAWRKAGRESPIIVFIDEIDSMGARGSNGRNESYWSAVINALLAFMDGAVSRDGVVVIAATNFPANVDSALKRPGRLDREIAIPRPDADALAGIVAHHLRVDAKAKETRDAARLLRGRSPADVEFACREVRRLEKTLKRKVDAGDLVDMLRAARAKVSPALDRTIRFHEAGHAIAALAVGRELISIDVDRVDTVHLRIDGHVISDDGDALQTREQQVREMAFCLAGRASEIVNLGYATVGAEGDLRSATYIASRAIRQHGLDGDLVSYATDGVVTESQLNRIRAMVDEAYKLACEIVRSWEVKFLAERLVEARFMTGAEVKAAISAAVAEVFFRDEDGPEPERWELCWEDSCPPKALAA